MANPPLSIDIDTVLHALTDEQKVALLNGHGMWRTVALPALGVPAVVMTDGAYGVRYSVDQIDGNESGGEDFSAFLDVVNQRARDMDAAFGTTRPATCFPTGSSIACSWDVDLAYELGKALAAECKSFGVSLLLGPGINIRRMPLAGRSYEYYGEDPLLTGDFAAGVINGLQDHGVGASLKHFACNNSEIERTTMDSVVDDRALREIYLAGFERAIRKSQPWTVMSSYNRLNGEQAAESPWLLTQVLRKEWGFEGLVVSDWHGIKDRANSLLAGNDLDMPESRVRKAQLLRAVRAGQVTTADLDMACRRVLQFVAKAAPTVMGAPFDAQAHHDLARRMASESVVLLKNRDDLLPLDSRTSRHLLVVGEGAVKAIIQGSGSATTHPTQTDRPLEEIRREVGAQVQVTYHPFPSGEDHTIIAAARDADAVIVFGNTDDSEDGEGADRKTLSLSKGQDAFISALAAVNRQVIVVLANPDAVVMPWIGDVGAVLDAFYAGQGMGHAIAGILFGRINPSGKLTVSFPRRIEDAPAWLTYPGERGVHRYSEGIFVGYRYFDARDVEPLFPFGFGLSYTRFAYDELQVSSAELEEGRDLTVRFAVRNAGDRPGKEIAQVYAAWQGSSVHRPRRELKGFAKVDLAPGEVTTVTVTLAARDLCFYDVETRAWRLDEGSVIIEVGASSRDIRLRCTLAAKPRAPLLRPLRLDSEPKYMLSNPIARAYFSRFLQEALGVTAEHAEKMLDYCASSFFGIHTTLNYFFRQDFEAARIQAVIDAVNRDSLPQASPS